MTADTVSIMGIFPSERGAAAAIDRLRETPWTIERVHSPIPSHDIEHALAPPKSKVGWFTLIGGIIGFLTGFALAAFTSLRWSLIVSGKPIVALVPFTIVGFEFTILFAVFGNVLGLISQARLPRFETPPFYDGSFTGDRFGVLARCNADETDELTQWFEENGAEIKPDQGGR
jgi:molybdopterin-containing oxidoreductase family membrane subunit